MSQATARRSRTPTHSNSAAAKRRRWARLPDDRLLDVRLCDLGLTVERSALQRRVQRLHEELDERGLRFRPHVWLSTEWFSPDGIPGIAAPFYLAHPRLTRLEEKFLLHVEGATHAQCMKILRHEAGHAISTAFRLHRRRAFRDAFGAVTRPYPDIYKPRPASRHHVHNLDWWYAQAHPAEDFAETFAVWLKPDSRWRSRYAHWPALRKLETVDAMMHEIAGQAPPVRSRKRYESIATLKTTVRAYLEEKQRRYAGTGADAFDTELRKLFSDDPAHAHRPTAASLLRRMRPELRDSVSRWTSAHPYTTDQVVRDMADRCKQLKLRLTCDERRARAEVHLMILAQTMKYLHGGNLPVAL